jgi:hypothetical protein
MPPADDDADLPSVEALVAGTIALTTSWADPCPDARVDRATQRALLARKIVSNLFFLCHHPGTGPELRQVLANAHQHWMRLARRTELPAEIAAKGRPALH